MKRDGMADSGPIPRFFRGSITVRSPTSAATKGVAFSSPCVAAPRSVGPVSACRPGSSHLSPG